MEHSKTNKPVLTALDILQFRNLQKQLLPPRNQLAPHQLSYVVAIDDSDSEFSKCPCKKNAATSHCLYDHHDGK